MRAVLVAGSTGLVGKGLEETRPGDVRMVGVHQRAYAASGGSDGGRVLDLRRPEAVERLFREENFEAVVQAAGNASVDYAETHPSEARESNVQSTKNLAEACRRSGGHFIYISTNAVFDGHRPPYAEGDPVNPINQYGRIKVECERIVAEAGCDFTIVRLILMYGWNYPQGRQNPATWLLEKLSRGEAVSMVTDVYENPLYSLQCGEALWRIVARKPAGMFHVAGADVVNRYEFALRLAARFGLSGSLIQPVDSSFFRNLAPRPRRTNFCTIRMETELGIRPLSLEEGLRSMKERGKRGA